MAKPCKQVTRDSIFHRTTDTHAVTYCRGSWLSITTYPDRDAAYEAFMFAGRDPRNRSVSLKCRNYAN